VIVLQTSTAGPGLRGADDETGAHVAELTLAGADGFVLSGSHQDLHPGLYGEEVGPHTAGADLARDRRDLQLIRQALLDDLPIVGVCRGSQLLNIALGGSLWQDLDAAGVAGMPHGSDASHRIRTGERSTLRAIVGGNAAVGGGHHQGIRRLGRGVRPVAVSPDGVVESVEIPSRRFALGTQWHPEAEASATVGPLLGEALVRAASAPAA
jgi:gamma-glutamyl-gamma-aminobutyrate hydrolase PuuD